MQDSDTQPIDQLDNPVSLDQTRAALRRMVRLIAEVVVDEYLRSAANDEPAESRQESDQE